MTFLVGLFLIFLTGLLIYVILRDHARGTCELVSIRNFVLIGFIIYQLTGTARSILTDEYGGLVIVNMPWTGLVFSAMVVVFLYIFFAAYNHFTWADQLASRVPAPLVNPPPFMLWTIATLLTLIAIVFRIGVTIPLVSYLSRNVGTGYSAVACGLIGWIWVRRFMNPVELVFGLTLIAMNLGAVMYGEFGRRSLVAVGVAFIWAMYYGKWRYYPLRKIMTRGLLIGIWPVILLSLFTSVRSPGEHQRTTREHLDAIRHSGDVVIGFVDLIAGQNTGSTSLWLIEAFDDGYEQSHLHTLTYFVYYPIPRDLWKNKPIPLSNKIASMANIPYVQQDKLTIGAGIIGHAAAEGGWYALILYALFFGFIIRFLDSVTRLNEHSPLIIMTVGCALGQILGLFRGETPAFLAIYTMTAFGCWVTMYIIGKVFERMMPEPLGEFVEDESDWSEDPNADNDEQPQHA